jgi:hypothetical protein
VILEESRKGVMNAVGVPVNGCDLLAKNQLALQPILNFLLA